jgi:ParE toxin of type II toxin-antitoxin system, parDE
VPYEIQLDPVALEEIRDFLGYLADFDPDVSARYETPLEQLIDSDLSESPHRFSWFWKSGPPYRGRLFHVSRRTKFWIIYTIDEERHRVDILHFWNASRDPSKLKL